MRRAVDREEAGSERFIRPGFRLIGGADLDSRLAGYERRSRPGYRVTPGALFHRSVASF
jgi:hypothetical protein